MVEAHENRSAGREKYTKCGEETLQQPYVVNYSKRDDKHVVRTIRQPRAENYIVLLLQVLYCNLETQDCQAPFKIKSALKI